MAPKFMVIGFFGLLLVSSMKTIEHRKSTESPHGLSTVVPYVQVPDLFHHEMPVKQIEKDDISKAICPVGYKLCYKKGIISNNLYHHCVETTESEVEVHWKYGEKDYNEQYTECTDPTFVDRDMFNLVFLTPKYYLREDTRGVLNDSILCKVAGKKDESGQASEIRYFEPSASTQGESAKRTKLWTDFTIGNGDTKFWYQIICGTKEEVEKAVVPNTRLSTRRKKVDTPAQPDLTYYVVVCVLILIVGGIFIYLVIAHCCCTKSNEQSEDEIKDVQLTGIWTESMSETMTHPNDFTISIEDLKKIQKQERESELSTIDGSLSEKSHSNEEISEHVDQQSITDSLMIISEDETSKPTNTNSSSLFSFAEETKPKEKNETKEGDEDKNDPEN